MEGRYYGEKIDLDRDAVRAFWDARGRRTDLAHRYVITQLHDGTQELTVQRDAHEKEIVRRVVPLREGCSVLDIGCGVGRWADLARSIGAGRYVGVEMSGEVLSIARGRFQDWSASLFLQGDLQDLRQVLGEAGVWVPYDLIICAGVLMYINDMDIDGCLTQIADLMRMDREDGGAGWLYLTDPCASESRLTLKDLYSREMDMQYHAIYRSMDEYRILLRRSFPPESFALVSSGPRDTDDLWDRKETRSLYWVFRTR